MTEIRQRPTIQCGPSLTKQSFRDECDINFIMSRWKRTGEMPPEKAGTMRPHYGDFSNPNDYMEAANRVIEANEAFESLPSFLRDRFANEPANLIAFLADPENQEEAIKLGLAERAPPLDQEVEEAPDLDPDPSPPATPIAGGE